MSPPAPEDGPRPPSTGLPFSGHSAAGGGMVTLTNRTEQDEQDRTGPNRTNTMSTLAALAIRALAHVGRWVIHQLAIWGRLRIMRYMKRRIRVFGRRARRWEARGRNLLASFNRGRIRRWTRAREWIKSNFRKLAKDVADKVEHELRERVPYHVDCECQKTWLTSPEARDLQIKLLQHGLTP